MISDKTAAIVTDDKLSDVITIVQCIEALTIDKDGKIIDVVCLPIMYQNKVNDLLTRKKQKNFEPRKKNLADIDGFTILEFLRENNQKTRVIKNPICGDEGQH